MSKIVVKVKLTNLKDKFLKAAGARKAKPREMEVEALVDTGATRLYLKPSVIRRLGLERTDTVRSQTTNGEAIPYKYEPVQLELMGRKENRGRETALVCRSLGHRSVSSGAQERLPD